MPKMSAVRSVRPWYGSSGKRGRQVAAAEPERGAVEIFFAGELEAERMRLAGACAPQHDRMMVALLDAAQVERILSPRR